MRIFDGCLGFEHFARNKETIMGTQGENKPVDPIFLLQFSNVLYTADNCAKFEKVMMVHHFRLREVTFINSLELLIPKRLELLEVEF